MNELYMRYIGSAPGYGRSDAFRELQPQEKPNERPLVPEIRNGQIVKWVTIDEGDQPCTLYRNRTYPYRN